MGRSWRGIRRRPRSFDVGYDQRQVIGGDVTGADDAVQVSSNGAKTVTVATGRTLTGGDLGIASPGTGATTVNNSGTITGTGVTIRSETSATTINNFAGGSITAPFSCRD